jgi:hypothetical protein
MGLCTLGVSGGQPVVNQLGGVTLSQAGDFATIIISNGAPPQGPDITGLFAITGNFVNAQITPQFVMNPVQYGLSGSLQPGQPVSLASVGANGNWQFLQGCTQALGAVVAGSLVPPNAQALQISLGSIAGLFAVRLYLNSIGSGSMLVSGNTNPAGTASLDALILASVIANTNTNKAQVLALSNQDSVDYLYVLTGSSY